MVVSMNRWSILAAAIIVLLMKINRNNQHLVKHIDSTDIPVCLFKNANAHKTMKGLARFGRSSKGTFFGLKLHIVTDLKRKLLSLKFTAGNVDDREVVLELTEEIVGYLIADAGYIKRNCRKHIIRKGKGL
jgi:hypothetical protein